MICSNERNTCICSGQTDQSSTDQAHSIDKNGISYESMNGGKLPVSLQMMLMITVGLVTERHPNVSATNALERFMGHILLFKEI